MSFDGFVQGLILQSRAFLLDGSVAVLHVSIFVVLVLLTEFSVFNCGFVSLLEKSEIILVLIRIFFKGLFR